MAAFFCEMPLNSISLVWSSLAVGSSFQTASASPSYSAITRRAPAITNPDVWFGKRWIAGGPKNAFRTSDGRLDTISGDHPPSLWDRLYGVAQARSAGIW